MARSIVMCFLTVPAEARAEALDALSRADAVGRFPGTAVAAAASFVQSGGTEIEDSELSESALFRAGVSAVEHMAAYTVPADSSEPPA